MVGGERIELLERPWSPMVSDVILRQHQPRTTRHARLAGTLRHSLTGRAWAPDGHTERHGRISDREQMCDVTHSVLDEIGDQHMAWWLVASVRAQ